MSTVLTLVQDFSRKMGLPVPVGLFGSTDATFLQLQALIMEIVEKMQTYKWEQQKIRRTWTGVVGENQGALTTLLPGFRNWIPDTFWNNTLRRPIYGPVTDVNYQSLKALNVAAPLYQFWIAGGDLNIVPGLASADTLSVIYDSKYTVIDVSNNPKERPTADDDSFIFPDAVFKLSLEWRWLKAKGESWMATMQEALNTISQAIGNDGDLPSLSFTGESPNLQPGIWVPAGSWNVN